MRRTSARRRGEEPAGQGYRIAPEPQDSNLSDFPLLTVQFFSGSPPGRPSWLLVDMWMVEVMSQCGVVISLCDLAHCLSLGLSSLICRKGLLIPIHSGFCVVDK